MTRHPNLKGIDLTTPAPHPSTQPPETAHVTTIDIPLPGGGFGHRYIYWKRGRGPNQDRFVFRATSELLKGRAP